MAHNFLSQLTGSFAMPAAENPTVAMVEAAYRHHGLDIATSTARCRRRGWAMQFGARGPWAGSASTVRSRTRWRSSSISMGWGLRCRDGRRQLRRAARRPFIGENNRRQGLPAVVAHGHGSEGQDRGHVRGRGCGPGHRR